MTSPSPTRRRTTRRRSTLEHGWGGSRTACGAVITVVAFVAATPAGAAWRDFQRTEPPRPVVVPAAAVEPEGGVVTPVVADTVVDPPALQPVAAQQPLQRPDPAGAAVSEAAATPCDEEAEACREALDKLRSDTLSGIDVDIRVGGRPGSDYPCECRLEGETFEPRRFATTTFTWKAAGYCHKPLYFEHWNLERYGHSHGFVADSFLSAAHFFARIPALPYEMGVELPWECVYPVGYYRPGSCAPWTVPAVPVSCRGLAVEAAAATGIVFILP